MERLPAPALPDWLAPQLPFRRYAVAINGWHLHVMESGPEDGPSVLLLHGNPTWSFLYRKVARALAGSGLRLVMPDLLGLGLSDKPRDAREHSLEHHAALIGALMDGLLPGPFMLVAQDWGGPIGLRAAADRTDRIAGLVLLNTVASPPRPDFRPSFFHRFARWPLLSTIAFRLFAFPQRALHQVQGDRASIQGDVARAYRWPLRGLSHNVAPLALARMVPDSFAHPSIDPLRRCQSFVESYDGPSAIVWGDRDPILGRTRGWMEKLLPRAAVTRTDAGHFLQEEVPDEIAAAIRSVSSARAANQSRL